MSIPVTRSPAVRGGMTSPRLLNVIVGTWLFISAFVWPHSSAQFTNTWIVGVACVGFALIAMATPAARYLNTLLAIWLFISAWALPASTGGTAWNNAIVAIAMFIISLVPSGPAMEPGGFLRGFARGPHRQRA